MTHEIEAKLILVGDANVGKTSIINRCVKNEFKEAIIPTLSSNYSLKTFNTGNRIVRLQIWDTAGDEKYRSIIPMFYRGSQAAFIVYAIDNLSSFQSVSSYVESLHSHLEPEKLILFLIANKIDKNPRQISTEEGEQCAHQINATYLEVSALTSQGITEAFSLTATQIADKNEEQPQEIKKQTDPEPSNCNC